MKTEAELRSQYETMASAMADDPELAGMLVSAGIDIILRAGARSEDIIDLVRKTAFVVRTESEVS